MKEELIEAYESYIQLLSEEMHELAMFAINRGWKSSRVDEGERLRNLIKQLKENEKQ